MSCVLTAGVATTPGCSTLNEWPGKQTCLGCDPYISLAAWATFPQGTMVMVTMVRRMTTIIIAEGLLCFRNSTRHLMCILHGLSFHLRRLTAHRWDSARLRGFLSVTQARTPVPVRCIRNPLRFQPDNFWCSFCFLKFFSITRWKKQQHSFVCLLACTLVKCYCHFTDETTDTQEYQVTRPTPQTPKVVKLGLHLDCFVSNIYMFTGWSLF